MVFNQSAASYIPFFSAKIVKSFTNNKKLDQDEIEKAGKHILYFRAWDYIYKVDLTKKYSAHFQRLKSKVNRLLDEDPNRKLEFLCMIEEDIPELFDELQERHPKKDHYLTVYLIFSNFLHDPNNL